MTPQDAYKELVKGGKELGLLYSTAGVLGWEERTYMPPQGAKLRSEQIGMLAGMIHEKFTDPKVGELLSIVEGSDMVKDPDSIEAANVRELRHQYDKETKLPKDLVEEISKVTSLAQGEWTTARKNSDFKAFLPWLEKVVKLTIQKADAYGHDGQPYNPLLDSYEPGATVADIEEVFKKLRGELVDLVQPVGWISPPIHSVPDSARATPESPPDTTPSG